MEPNHDLLFEDGDYSRGYFVQVPTCRTCRDKYLTNLIGMYRDKLKKWSDELAEYDIELEDKKISEDMAEMAFIVDTMLDKTDLSPFFEYHLNNFCRNVKDLAQIITYLVANCNELEGECTVFTRRRLLKENAIYEQNAVRYFERLSITSNICLIRTLKDLVIINM
jgi:hypothetical protein